MFHVDNNSAVPVMPAVKPVVSAVTSFFTEGGNGVPPTYPGPDWFNIIQSELLAVLAAAGITPDKASNVQLLAAMRALFLDTSQNGADIQDKALFLQNLGLGAAAKRDVGTGTNQIPDMGSFTSQKAGPTSNGWQKLPGGLIVQWYTATHPADSTAWSYNFPIPFPNAFLADSVVVSGATNNRSYVNGSSASNTARQWIVSRDQNTGGSVSLSSIVVGW